MAWRPSMSPSTAHRSSSQRQPSAVDSSPHRKAAGLSSQGGPETGRIRGPALYRSLRPRSQTCATVSTFDGSWACRARTASPAVSHRSSRSSVQESLAARTTRSRSGSSPGCRSSTHWRIFASSSLASSWGSTGATTLARSPCFREFRLAFALPDADLGPVDMHALRLLASICAAVAMVRTPGGRHYPEIRIPLPGVYPIVTGNLLKFRKYFSFMDEIDVESGDIAQIGERVVTCGRGRDRGWGGWAVPGRRSRTASGPIGAGFDVRDRPQDRQSG